MTLVVFVHGTGVRGPSYAKQFSQLTERLSRVRSNLRVAPCLWGERLGASLQGGGRSVSDYEETRGGRDPSTSWDEERWILLREDPLFELRLLAAAYRQQGRTPLLPGDEPPLDRYRRLVLALTENPRLCREAEQDGVATPLAAALTAVVDSEPATAAIQYMAANDDGELREAFARAVVAQVDVLTPGADHFLAGVGAERRDEYVSLVADGLGGAPLGVGTTALKIAGTLAMRLGVARALERRRGLIADSLTPVTGDVLRYLAHGDAVRALVASYVSDSTEPVVLLGHSLGGVICVDTAAMGLAAPAMIVTFGAQVSFLHELGALPSLTFGHTFPDSFPDWINILDERDLLAYPAEGIFPGRVRDVSVRHGDPFPQAHSRYVDTDDFYNCLAKNIP